MEIIILLQERSLSSSASIIFIWLLKRNPLALLSLVLFSILLQELILLFIEREVQLWLDLARARDLHVARILLYGEAAHCLFGPLFRFLLSREAALDLLVAAVI